MRGCYVTFLTAKGKREFVPWCDSDQIPAGAYDLTTIYSTAELVAWAERYYSLVDPTKSTKEKNIEWIARRLERDTEVDLDFGLGEPLDLEPGGK